MSEPPRERKVLFIGHNASRTGAPLLLLHFLKWLRQNSVLQFEILLGGEGELLPDYGAIAPTKLFSRGVVTKPQSNLGERVRRKLHLAPPLDQQLRKFYPLETFPLIYANTVTNSELVCAFSKLGHRIICHAHEMSMAIDRWGGAQVQEAAQRTDVFIAASQGVKASLGQKLSVAPEKVQVIHPFGQPVRWSEPQQHEARRKIRAELGARDDDIVVGMCGTTDWRKGADLFPLLAKAVANLQPSGRFLFVWIGATLGSLEHRQIQHDISLLKLEETVKLLGVVDNPQEYLSALDLFALVSREDPFPMVMLEAAALSVPIVCFASSGGGPEMTTSGGGIVVPYLDVVAFAKAIVSLAGNQPLRAEMGRVLREKAEAGFTIDSQSPKYLAIVEGLLNRSDGN